MSRALDNPAVRRRIQMLETRMAFVLVAGFTHLVLLKYLGHMADYRPEIVTQINSISRVKEGLFLRNLTGNAYIGDLVHEQPLVLWFLDLVREKGLELILLFTCHLLCGLLLSRASRHIAKDIWKGSFEIRLHDSSKDLVLDEESYVKQVPGWVLKAYFLNPFVLLNFLGGTTTVYQNLFLAASLLGTSQGSVLFAVIPLAFAAYQNLYAAAVIVPASLYVAWKRRSNSKASLPLWTSFVGTLIVFLLTLSALLFASSCLTGNWEFLKATYGFVLRVPDLRPNIGLFWYFFIEMFEHFENFFLCVFQINGIVYVLPLTIRLYKDPPLLLYVVISLLAIFKSYPCVGDVGFYMALLPLWSFTFRHMRYNFIVVCMFIASVVLGPILWHLWIYSGSANANFFFAITLVFNTAQIFLLTDIIFGKMKHDFLLEHGTDMKIDGQEAILALE